MTNKEIKAAETIAVYSFGYYGLEIKAVLYGIDDAIAYTDPAGNAHKRRIYYNASGSSYFYYHNRRIRLDECLRV